MARGVVVAGRDRWNGICPPVFLLVRDGPEVCNLQTDNQQATSQIGHQQTHKDSHTLKQLRGNIVFWLYSLGLFIQALGGTAVTFHIVAILEAVRSRAEALASLIPQAMFSVVTNPGVSALADYVRLKPFLLVMLTSFTLGAVGLIFFAA